MEITPQTKVGDLLERYPELEEVLIARAPAFAKLKNPVLRRTVGKVATLAQAGGVAGIPPLQLVQELRQAIGMPPYDPSGDARAPEPPAPGFATPAGPPPAWFDPAKVAIRIDGDQLLAAGRSPLAEANERLSHLPPGGILAVTTTFMPQPLVEALEKAGRQAWVTAESEGRCVTYLRTEEGT